MSSSSSCVEWSWQRAQGRPSRTPAALRRGDDRQAAATGRRAPGCAARWRPAAGRAIAATGAAVWPGVAPRARRQACQQRRGIAVEPERQALVVAFQAQTQAHRSAWLRRAQAVPDQAGKDVAFALQQGQLQAAGRLAKAASCRFGASQWASAGAWQKAQGQAVPRQAQFEIDVGGGLGDVQARLQSVAGIVATATRETSLEIQFGAAGERQVEVRTVHSACHSSCR